MDETEKEITVGIVTHILEILSKAVQDLEKVTAMYGQELKKTTLGITMTATIKDETPISVCYGNSRAIVNGLKRLIEVADVPLSVQDRRE